MSASAPEGNPAFNMLGLPRIKTWKLPSRNWLIFWSVIGSFAGGVSYDRYEKRRIMDRYKRSVEYLAQEPLGPLQMPRKMNIYLGAPPGDTIHVVREHFNEYVKPILNAAAIDFEIIEGKMQGDIRHRIAQAIRDRRRGVDGMTQLTRAAKEKLEYDSLSGDLVIGRHTFKEYLRGQHEGVLGPLDEPASITAIMNPRMPGDPLTEPDQVDDSTMTEEEKTKAIEEIKKKIPNSPPSYIAPSDYAAAEASTVDSVTYSYIPLQHLLGFLNTPWRIYRFLNRRKLAEEVCSATTAAVLSHTREMNDDDVSSGIDEEQDWPKLNRTKPDGVWVEKIVTDERVMKNISVYRN